MRGFLDDDELAPIRGLDLKPEFFDRLEKSKEFILRAEAVMSEIALLQYDLKELWNEAREYGIEVEVLKDVIRRRKKSKAALDAHEAAVFEVEQRMDGLNEYGDEYDPDAENINLKPFEVEEDFDIL